MACASLLDVSEDGLDPQELAALLLERAEAVAAAGRSSNDLARYLAIAEQQADDLPDPVASMEGAAISARRRGDLVVAVEFAKRALCMAEERGESLELPVGTLATTLVRARRYAEAVPICLRHVQLSRASGSLGALAVALDNLAEAHMGAGSGAEAILCFDEVVAIFRSVNPNHRALPGILARRAEAEGKLVGGVEGPGGT